MCRITVQIRRCRARCVRSHRASRHAELVSVRNVHHHGVPLQGVDPERVVDGGAGRRPATLASTVATLSSIGAAHAVRGSVHCSEVKDAVSGGDGVMLCV
jgi:hypothetical protein